MQGNAIGINGKNSVDKETLISLQERAEELHKNDAAYSRAELVDFIIMLVIAFVVAMVINRFVIRIVRVDGSSMFPTFASGERVLTEKVSFNFIQPKRGDVVICTYKDGPSEKGYKKIDDAIASGFNVEYDSSDIKIEDKWLDDSNFEFERVIKRVVGLPGETIEVKDGKIFINGESIDESAYWNDMIYSEMEEYVIPEDRYFVVGDNRNFSKDSREYSVGSIPTHRLQGRVVIKIWPFSEFGSFAGKA